MRFSVPVIWDYKHAEELKGYADEFYGKLSSDLTGGGRPSAFVPSISRKEIKDFVSFFHRIGIKFNYLLNGACLDNREFTASGQRELRLMLDWLQRIEVDSVTVSIPYLLEIIKKRHPGLKTCVSVYSGVDSVEKARFWENLGADRITLYSAGITRKFQLLKAIRKNVKCRLQIFANNSCIYECPMTGYHSLILTHSSQSPHPSKGFIVDYCRLSCMRNRIMDPSSFIRSEWVRPEDLDYYEEIGIDGMKLLDRMRCPQDIVSIVKAYWNRSFDGNLLDLLFAPGGANIWQRSKFIIGLKYFFRPFLVNIFKLRKTANMDIHLNDHVYLDNRALDGFLRHFLEIDCSLLKCGDCGYCAKIAESAVKIDKDWQLRSLAGYDSAINGLVDGSLYSYFKR
jgi:collagenase-like PrtC family protease